MKAYKKIATIVPIAVLSTSVLFTPVMTFAAGNPVAANTTQIHTLATSNSFSKTEFINWVNTKVGPKLNGMFGDGTVAVSRLNEKTLEYSYTGGSLNLQGTPVGDGSPEFVTLGTMHNTTEVNQILKTDSKSIAITKSFTVSNAEGAKLTVGAKTNVSVGIPLLAEGKVEFSVSAEANYQHTSSDTLSKTETITFPSQDIQAAPHGTTTLSLATYKQQFKGTDSQGLVEVKGKVQDQRGNMYTLYDAIKVAYSKGEPLPSYLTIDDVNKRILVKGMKTDFSGVAGYYTKGEVTFKPDNSNQKAVKMSLEDYKNPTTRAKLLQQNQ